MYKNIEKEIPLLIETKEEPHIKIWFDDEKEIEVAFILGNYIDLITEVLCMNLKHKRGIMNKPTKWQSQIDIVHREWCRENGYPVHWYRARHGRPKLNKQANKHEKYVGK